MADSMAIDVQGRSDVVLLCVTGEVDLATAPELRHAILTALASQRHVVVSIQDVQYMDLAGFHALEAGLNTAIETQKFALVASPPNLERVIKIIRFNEVVSIFGSEQEALAFVRDRNAP